MDYLLEEFKLILRRFQYGERTRREAEILEGMVVQARNIAEQLRDEVSRIKAMLCEMNDSRSFNPAYETLQQIYIMKLREQETWGEISAIISSCLN